VPLSPPPRDGSGQVIPHDHDGIAAGDGVIRRISTNQIVTDRSGQKRISSIAFKPSSGLSAGMSVDFEVQIAEAGLDARTFVTTPYWTGSVWFTAGQVRQLGLLVGSDPIPQNPYHGEVWGIRTKAQQKQLQALAIWFVEISGVLVAPP